MKTQVLPNNVVVIYPKGRLIGGSETDELQTAIHQQAESGNVKLILNLKDVSYLNSTAIGVIMAGFTNYQKRGGKMKLCNLSDSIENIFVITKLTLVFEVFNNELEAVASFAS